MSANTNDSDESSNSECDDSENEEDEDQSSESGEEDEFVFINESKKNFNRYHLANIVVENEFHLKHYELVFIDIIQPSINRYDHNLHY